MRQRRTVAAWRMLVAGHAGGGLTVPAYCAREGICRGSFYRWRTKLAQMASEPMALPRSASSGQGAPFVDLGALRGGSARFEVRLELGDGLTLSIARS